MQARGMLMMEHRSIERIIALMERAIAEMDTTGRVDPLFVDAAVDFIGTYADRVHHGKEEDILFRELGTKDLSAEDRTMMESLLADHRFGRETTRALVAAKTAYCAGEDSAAQEIARCLRALVSLYPQHIQKEDKVFFPGSRRYLSDDEDRAMLVEFREFDRNMIHEKYQTLLDRLGG